MGRGVTGLFYAAPGVASGGGTGTANPSISGATGLENNYIADGVSITDGAFGGIGVYSRVYGSLSSGINLSFVKEVQVKTGGFEAQYGKATGGIVQIVTKTGSNAFHGSVGGYVAPQQLEATRVQVDDLHLPPPAPDRGDECCRRPRLRAPARHIDEHAPHRYSVNRVVGRNGGIGRGRQHIARETRSERVDQRLGLQPAAADLGIVRAGDHQHADATRFAVGHAPRRASSSTRSIALVVSSMS